jgi:hypothetical protein
MEEKPILLFLDDQRVPIDCTKYMYRKGINVSIYYENWNIVRSYLEFVKWVENNGLPDLISFDHDLADVVELRAELPIETWFDLDANKEYTGMDCAKWLVNYCLDNKQKLPKFIVHSSNPAGSDNIESLLKSFEKHNID